MVGEFYRGFTNSYLSVGIKFLMGSLKHYWMYWVEVIEIKWKKKQPDNKESNITKSLQSDINTTLKIIHR